MKIYLATDHAGYTVKEAVKAFLLGENYEVEDCGAVSFDPHDNYPDFIAKAAEKISHNPFDFAIIFGGNGQGEAMVANKFPNVRAAVFYGTKEAVAAVDVSGTKSTDPFEIIRLTREHTNANVLSIGARFVEDEDAIEAVKLFLHTPFPALERHAKRLAKITEIEKEIHEYD